MSDDPMLRWGFDHEQTPHSVTYYVVNRFKKRQRPRRVTEPVPAVPTVAQVADTNRLITIFYEMKTKAGQAPGPDGVTYADLGGREVADIMRDLGRDVRAGTYRPSPTRPVRIAKPGGGHRILALGGLLDRVLAASLNQAMEGLWEKGGVFLPCSFGFRPRRGVWPLLAEVQHVMVTEGRWVLALDDVRSAFPSVIIDDVLADHARYVTDKSLLSLIEVVLRGGDKKRTRGIDQGSPYSPTALNVRLHHALDLGVMQGHHLLRLFRYADNVTWLCRSMSEGHQALNHARQLLEPAGFTLKGEDGIRDLRQGQTAHVLGFTLSRRDGHHLQLDLGKDAWTKLEQNLVKAHDTQDPSATAESVVGGWLAAFGPAFENWRTGTLNRILQTGRRMGFREIGSRDHLADLCETAWRRWDTFRKGVEQASHQDEQQAGIR
jgi:hypothetical protein